MDVTQRPSDNLCRYRTPLLKGRHGSAPILLVYGTILVLSSITAAMLQLNLAEIGSAQHLAEQQQAFYMAEGGADKGLAWLAAQSAPPDNISSFDPFNGPQHSSSGQFTVTIVPGVENATSYNKVFIIESLGQNSQQQIQRLVKQSVHSESFARYAYFTNLERTSSGTPIWFTSRDHLEGPIHTNEQFNIFRDPVFDGPVSSVNPAINYYNGGPPNDNPVFNQGLALGAAEITLPMKADSVRAAALQNGGLWLSGNTTITLQSDGWMVVTNAVKGWVNHTTAPPNNGVLFVNGGNLTVKGTLKGRLTLGTSHNVMVADAVRYSCDPLLDTNCTDVLGMVAEQNVVIASKAPTDVTIHSSLMALNGSFTVENWWQGPPKDTLTVLGGIIQHRRGPVGTFNGKTGQKVSGYTKDYRYDERLRNTPPPFFPTTGQYELLGWSEEAAP